MKPKAFLPLIFAAIVIWLTLFEVNFTRAQEEGPLLASTPTRLPPSTPMPNQLQDKIQKELESRFSTTASTNSPIRGIPGDWWADVVIGQPGFGQITPNEVVGNKIFNPGGIQVDRSTIPNRVYVYDAGNSRILGFSSLGACAAGANAGRSCTSNSDCPSSVCTIDSSRPADIILGQPSPYVSACNGDSGFQTYPDFPAPTANTLCGLRPEGASILEGGSAATMATDGQGNLYHPDYLNNRIVRYNNPFNNDTTADFVWGQADFNHGSCNEGRSYGLPDEDSLCLIAPLQTGSLKSGVAIDSNGNLWVADTQNNRVLRFPYNSIMGMPSKSANLVLGQSNFTNAVAGNGLGQMDHPSSVRVDASGKVYVLDGVDGSGTTGRLMIFVPPLSMGMSASQVFNRPVEPTGLELDASGQLWINESDSQQILRLVNGQLQIAIANVPYGSWGGMGIDRDGNVMLTGWNSQEVQIYSAPTFTWTSTFLQADQYGYFNHLGPHGMTDPGGLEVTSNQLIIADQSRLLFWNNPSLLTNNYPPADGVIGQLDFVTRPRWGDRYGRMRADTQGKLWIFRDDAAFNTHILAYQLPLLSHALPIIDFSSPLPLKGGGSLNWSEAFDLGGMAYQSDCDCLWVSDTDYSRVFRINQVSSPNRYVDIVLGQKSADGIHCNQGRDSDDGYVHPQLPSRDSLCHPGGLAFDRYGNLFVSDHNLELAGNWRLLEYNAAGLPSNPNAVIFGLPASRVYGRNGSFTEPNCQGNDPICGPWEPVFYPNNDMVIGFNTYLGPAFPQVYQDPLTHSLPYTALGDYYSHAYSARLDSLNNLYVLDMTRSHVLIYRAEHTTPPTFSLTVNKNGTGSGVITSKPAGITCGTDCTEAYDSGTLIVLTATPASGHTFVGWGGDPDCSDGQVIMNASKTCTATFDFHTYTLTVNKTGAGSGLVTSNPAGINCGSDCSENYGENTNVTLVATPLTGSVFAGWSGDCLGMVSCVVNMTVSRSVTANFYESCTDCGPANSAWPLYRQNTSRTAQSSSNGPTSPGILWTYDYPSYDGSSPAIGPDGRVYAGLHDRLYAFNPDGTVNWSYTMGGLVRSPAIASNGTVYASADDGKFYALNSNGTLKWIFTTGSWISDSPALSPDGIIYFGSSNGNLYALWPNGTLKWSYMIGSWQNPSPAIGLDGTIYQGSTTGRIYALTSDGQLKWDYPTESYVDSTPALGADGTVYIGSLDHYLYALNTNGTLRWRYPTGNEVGSPAIGKDGTIYVSSRDNYLYAINNNGTLKWRYFIGDSVHNPSIDGDGTIYVGSNDSYLYAFTPSGTLKWRILLGGLLESDPAIGTDHNIYITSGGMIYAIGNCYILTLTANPTQGGIIIANPPPNCNNGTAYQQGTVVTLTASSNAGYGFTGWSGACTQTGSCMVSMSTAKSVTASFTTQPSITNLDIVIGGNPKESYTLLPIPSLITHYQNKLDGPVKVINTKNENIITSQRVYYGNSFNELMGYPSDQFTTEYWFPWYDQKFMQTWILVGNPSTTQTAYANIYINGVQQKDQDGNVKTYEIAPGDRVTPQFPGVVDGPVRVVSVTGPKTATPINIFASERSLYGDSFNEVMGYPTNKFTTEYWFPWYDQQYMRSWILVGNPSTTQDAYVDIYIGGVRQKDQDGNAITYKIKPGQRIVPQFPGILDGPVKVVSVTGTGVSTPTPIFTSERSLYGTSFNEVMGYPAKEFTTEYNYTWYDNQTMQTWVLVGNPSTTQTAYVDIYIGGQKLPDIVSGKVQTYVLKPGERITPQFAANTGPVRVVSVTGQGTTTPVPVFTSERSLYRTGFNEMMGYPKNQLTNEYWFTWYDSIYMNTEIYVSKP